MNIQLNGLNGNVVLPWYASASTAIPRYILDNNKKADGWFMIYNTCSPSDFCEPYKYYLIFYNVFTGLMRGYVYNPFTIQSQDYTFWQISFNQPTKLLHTYGEYAEPHNVPASLDMISIGNITTSPVKAMTKGWNCFEIDLSEYDYDLDKSQLNFSVVAYDLDKQFINLNGKANFEAEGEIIAQAKETSSNNGKNLLYAGGKAAVNVLESLIKMNNASSSSASNDTQTRGFLIDGLIKAGQYIIKKLTSKGEEPQAQNYDFRCSIDGTIVIDGLEESLQNTNILPTSGLTVPGSQMLTNGAFLPSYDNSVGVWTLERLPVINYVSYTTNFIMEEPVFPPVFNSVNNEEETSTSDITPIVPGGRVMTVETTRAVVDSLENLVRINPDILQYLEKYEINAEIIEDPVSSYLGNSSTLNTSYSDDRIIVASSSAGKRIVRWNGKEMMIVKRTYHGYDANNTELFKYGNTLNYNGQPLAKITVKLYPKEPFNSEPVILMRTYQTTKVYNRDLVEGFPSPLP